MNFINKYKSKLGVALIIFLLITCSAIGTPIVIESIKDAQTQAIKLESKAKAKEAWQNEFDNGNIQEDEIFEWDDGTYYWVIDFEGNVNEK